MIIIRIYLSLAYLPVERGERDLTPTALPLVLPLLFLVHVSLCLLRDLEADPLHPLVVRASSTPSHCKGFRTLVEIGFLLVEIGFLLCSRPPLPSSLPPPFARIPLRRHTLIHPHTQTRMCTTNTLMHKNNSIVILYICTCLSLVYLHSE